MITSVSPGQCESRIMQIPKCYIAQRKTGEIVAFSQLNSIDDEWLCHHCRCPLIFHPPTRTSPPWFEHETTGSTAAMPLSCSRQWKAFSSVEATAPSGTTPTGQYDHPLAMQHVRFDVSRQKKMPSVRNRYIQSRGINRVLGPDLSSVLFPIAKELHGGILISVN